MSAYIPWLTRETKRKKGGKKGDPEDKERNTLINRYKQMKFGEMNRIKMVSEPDSNIVPFTGFRVTTADDVSELAILHLQDRDKWEDFHFPKYKCALYQEIKKIFASHDLNLLPFDEFHDNWLLTGLTHRVPENWCYKPKMITMGFMPPDLLDSLQLFLRGNNNSNIRRANNNRSNISHVAKKDRGSGWYVYLTHQEGLSLDCRTQIFTKAFSEMVIKNLGHKVSPKMFSKVNRKHALIGTVFAAEQDPHCDFTDPNIAAKTLVVHAPLTTEGAVLSVFDTDHNTHRYVYVPFGTFLVMRGDVWHSGFYGSPGNVRFHMIITMGDVPERDDLLVGRDRLDDVLAARPGNHDEFLEYHHKRSKCIVDVYTDYLNDMYYGHFQHELGLFPLPRSTTPQKKSSTNYKLASKHF